MTKLPWWKQIWFWLLIAMLAITLIHFTYHDLNSTIFTAVLFCFLTIGFWLLMTMVDRGEIKIEKKRLAEIKRKVKLFENLTGRNFDGIPILEVDDFQIYYLIGNSTVIVKTTHIDPIILNTVDRNTKNWLVEMSCTVRDFNSKIFKEVAYGIGWAKGETKSWELLNHHLIDQDGTPIEVRPELGIVEIEKILNFTRKYRSAKEFAFERICPYAAHVIASTKHSYESPILKELRKLLENPFSILEEGIDSQNTL